MVREVVNDLHPAGLAAEFLPPRHAIEAFQARANLVRGETGEGCRCHRHRRIADIELAGHPQRVSFSVQREGTTIHLVLHIGDPQRAALAKSHRAHRARRIGRHVEAVRVVAVDDRQAGPRHHVEQAAEGQLDLVEVRVDVGVVELDVVHHRDFRQVVKELRTLVEEGRVVFIAFQHVEVGLREIRAAAEVLRQPADHPAGIAAGGQEQPAEHRAGGRLAMGAGHHVVPLAAQEVLFHHLWQGLVEQLAGQRGFRLLVAPADRVADDDDIRPGRQILRPVAFGDHNPLAAQEVRHRRIDVVVGAGDGEALALHRNGHRAHGRPADAGEMEMLLIGHVGSIQNVGAATVAFSRSSERRRRMRSAISRTISASSSHRWLPCR